MRHIGSPRKIQESALCLRLPSVRWGGWFLFGSIRLKSETKAGQCDIRPRNIYSVMIVVWYRRTSLQECAVFYPISSSACDSSCLLNLSSGVEQDTHD